MLHLVSGDQINLMATTTRIIDIDIICNNVYNIIGRFFEEMTNHLDQQDQNPQPEITTLAITYKVGAPQTMPIISTLNTEINPIFVPTDASKWSSDGGSTATNFYEMHQKFIKLDSRLHAIEQACGHEDAIITDI